VATGCGRCRSHVHQMLQKTPQSSFSGPTSCLSPRHMAVSAGWSDRLNRRVCPALAFH